MEKGLKQSFLKNNHVTLKLLDLFLAVIITFESFTKAVRALAAL